MFFATYEISWQIQIILSMLMYVVVLYEIVSILLSMLTYGISLTCLILCPCWGMEFPKTKLVAVHADVCNFLLPCWRMEFLTFHADIWNFFTFHADIWNFLLSMLTWNFFSFHPDVCNLFTLHADIWIFFTFHADMEFLYFPC